MTAERAAPGETLPTTTAPSSRRASPSRRRWSWLAMAVLALGGLAIGVLDDDGPQTPAERAQQVAESLMCPTCRGQSVADSDSTAARAMRTRIRARVDEGAGDEQIRDELAARYGEGILLTPERSGLAGLVWVLPVVALAAAAAGVVLAFRRWRGRTVLHASSADRALVGRALEESRSP